MPGDGFFHVAEGGWARGDVGGHVGEGFDGGAFDDVEDAVADEIGHE